MIALLLSGIVLFAVPFLLLVGFSIVIFIQFLRDDDDASGVLYLGLISMFFGAVLIAAYFLLQASA